MVRTTSRVGKKGQVTIPARIRKVLGLGPGDMVYFQIREEELVVRPMPSLLAGFGAVKPKERPEDFKRMSRETTVTTKHLGEGLAADYDAEGHLAGIEILDATKRLGDGDVFKQVVLQDVALGYPRPS